MTFSWYVGLRYSREGETPVIGIRRWGDRCHHEVEEELADGYIVQGVFIAKDEVVSVIRLEDEEAEDADESGDGD